MSLKDQLKLELAVDRVLELQSERNELSTMLKHVEWLGYDTESGERACPCCEAWAFQTIPIGPHSRKFAVKRVEPKHRYACALATLIGAPMEEGVSDEK